MKRKFIYLLLISLSLPVLLWASDANKKEGRINNAETLVASKQESDLSYKQIMELMGKGSALIHEGILRENSIMVEQGSQLIDGHYAPYHKPWDMFERKEDQEAFKQMLLIYDRILHDASHTIETLAKQKDWRKAVKQEGKLSSACVSCHSIWKHKNIVYPPRTTAKE